MKYRFLTVGGWVIIAVTLACPFVCRALDYKPKPGESLSYVSLIHYGDPDKYIYLAAANSIADPNKIPDDITLWVPTVWKYRMKKGDYLAKLAKQYLRGPERSQFIMWLNKIRDPLEIIPGTVITMPFVLRHRVKKGDTMATVAEKYYRSRRSMGLLRTFNQKKSNYLKPGEVVDVPIFDEEASYAKVKERLKRFDKQETNQVEIAHKQSKRENSRQYNKATQSITPTPVKNDIPEQAENSFSSSPKFDLSSLLDVFENRNDRPLSKRDLLRLARNLYWNGNYEEAEELIAEALESRRKLSPAIETSLRKISASCLVAMDRIQEAEKHFLRILELNPRHTLNPIKTSPKILAVFERAKEIINE